MRQYPPVLPARPSRPASSVALARPGGPAAPGAAGEPAVRGYAVTHPAGRVVLPAATGWNQLLFASAGVMTVETAAGRWVVPLQRALWMPEGARPRIVMHGRVSIRTLYLDCRLPVPLDGWRAVNVSRLLRELIIHAVGQAPLDLARLEHERLIGVLLDQLAGMAQQPLVLPHPADERAQALARAITGPAGGRTIDELAQSVGASRRTLERTFLAETGLTIGAWRQRQRLLRALELLAQGEPVTSVALAVGYRTPSVFTAMFHDQLGTTPTRYFQTGG